VPEEPKKNYPGNSYKSKAVDAPIEPNGEERKPKHDKVITGTVIKRKPTLGQKIAATFTGDDAKSLGEYLLLDVAIPAIKALIVEATEQGIQRLMFGDVRPRSSGSRSYTSYNRMSSSPTTSYRRPGPREEPRTMSRTAKATHNFDEIILPTSQEAEDVIDGLRNIFDEYGVVTVSDLYDLVDVTSEWTDEKYGWTDRDFSVRRIREGFLIDLSKPHYLE